MNLKRYVNSFGKFLAVFAALYLIIAAVFYWIVADNWTRTFVQTDAVQMGQLLPADAVVEQAFTAGMNEMTHVVLVPHVDDAAAGSITLTLHDGQTQLAEKAVDAAALAGDQENTIVWDQPVEGVKGRQLTLRVETADTGVTLWAGSTMNAGRFDIAVVTDGLTVDGQPLSGNLVMKTAGYNLLRGSMLFWPAALAVLALCVAVLVVNHRRIQQGKMTVIALVLHLCERYRFLVKQLVRRDFSVKYRSSMLGVFWSFLNPLLTMTVYLVVFSTIFHSDIPHFPVYLMSGIVMFNFFSESTSLGLASIVSNGSLITKVYMPKVIYPMSRILSSTVNLCISFVPLLIVMLVTGVPFCKSLLLLPLSVVFLLMFSLGVSLILSTMNVFFRDTQFLWSVVLTMLNFLTPVFYPESIIPAQLQTLYRMNPMYQILFFMRSITIGGVSPTPVTYLYCILSSAGVLALGLWIFRKNQDKFVLYL